MLRVRTYASDERIYPENKGTEIYRNPTHTAHAVAPLIEGCSRKKAFYAIVLRQSVVSLDEV